MAVKPLLIKGTLSNGFLNYNVIDFDLSVGKWLICLKQVVFDTIKEEIQTENISISTNLISDYREVKNQKEFYYPTLAIFSLKNDHSIVLKSFDSIWFEINNPHKIIELFFKDCFSEVPLVLVSNVAVQVLLKKVC